MRKLSLAVTVLVVVLPLAAQMDHGAPKKAAAQPAAATLAPGFGRVHHPVTTSNAEAQKFFDQGLNLIYGFNHAEAEKAFAQAAKLDPNLAMAHWGIAYSVGPNYNMPVDWERELQAYDHIQQALKLAPQASKSEQAYIAALAKRYTNDKKADLNALDLAFANAMRDLKDDYPDDLDAATLFAESMMQLRPWKLWTPDGQPAPGTEEIVATLEGVLRRDPNHIGAAHYYIHAVEASESPERALNSADRLGALAPQSGHLVHMPAHIYIRTGDFDNAAKVNEAAALADAAYLKRVGQPGLYTLMYYSHNLHFLAAAYGADGRFAAALRSTGRLEKNVDAHVAAVPMLEGFMPTRYFVLARFHRWDDILKLPAPAASRHFQTAMYHYARGVAAAAKQEIAAAEGEHAALVEHAKAIPPDMMVSTVGNTAAQVAKVADAVLAARIAEAKAGPARVNAAVIDAWKKALVEYDKVAYSEPPDWYYSVRESLGAALLRANDYQQAEQVFRDDLAKNRRSGRSLFGLALALKGQGKDYDSSFVMNEYKSAWQKAEKPLQEGDL